MKPFRKSFLSLSFLLGWLTFAAASSQGQPVTDGVLTNGLIAYFPFAGSADDKSGHKNNGVVNGATLTDDRFGSPQNAYSFDGVTNYIRIQHPLTTAQPFTWSVWFRPRYDLINYTASLLNQGGDPGQTQITPDLGVGSAEDGRFSFYTWDGHANWVHSARRNRYDTNHWYHLVATSDADGARCLYVDGVCEGTATGQQFGEVMKNFYIGAQVADRANWFTGEIDDVRIYDRALSPAEVEQLYTAESKPMTWLEVAVSKINVTMHVLLGHNYVLQSSSDLQNWQQLGAQFTAQTALITQEFTLLETGRYFRLVEVP